MSYGQLGNLAVEQRDFAAAEQWYRKSLAISEKQGNEHGAAITLGQLGICAGLQESYEESADWLIRSIVSLTNSGDANSAKRNLGNLQLLHRRADEAHKRVIREKWKAAGMGDFLEPAAEPEG